MPPPVGVGSSSSQNSVYQIMDSNQLKQLSAPLLGGSSAAIVSALSASSANGSTTSRHITNQYSNSFWENYEHLCALQNLMPLQSLKASLSTEAGSNLVINADKLKTADWDPLLSSLRVTRNLKNITITSSYIQPNENDPSETARLIKGYAKLKKPPSIRNKERTNKLCRSLKDCLSISLCLSKLELYNIPLTVKDCSQIAKGLRSNKTIKLLSLDRCLIGDEGLAAICKEIQNSSNLNRVNFSSCNLTHEGANILATLIKVQALKRHNEAWKDSLRYGRPDLDSMFGIRRITINSNQQIGDKGVQSLADAFKSDLWLKALDLQDCGITTEGANHLLDGLKFNAMMHVLDVRLNVNIDRDTLQKIMEQVMINSSGNNTEYEWMDLTQAAVVVVNSPSKNFIPKINKESTSNLLSRKLKKRRNTNASFSKKSQFAASANSLKMKRCKSTGSVICNKSPSVGAVQQANRQQQQQSSNGIPWRTAARANRYRVSTSCAYRKVNGLSSSNNGQDGEYDDENEEEYDEEILDDYEDEENCQEEENEFVRAEANKLSHRSKKSSSGTSPTRNYMMASSTFDHEKFANNKFAQSQTGNGNLNPKIGGQQAPATQSRKIASTENLSNNEFVSNLDKIKNVSVKDLLTILQKEQESKTQLEDILLNLQEENTKLKSQISVYKTKLEQQQQQINALSSKQNQNTSTLNRTLLDDDKALEIIELTLYKYQNFLDFLRNAGFGKLIDIGEMNQQQQHSNSKLSKQQKQQKQTAELLQKQQKKLAKQSSSPQKDLTDQQKYYLNKINKTKNKLQSKNIQDDTLGEIYNSSRLNVDFDSSLNQFDSENHNIDTLLSNALEISRSYRRFNSSSINNSTMYNHPSSKRNNNDMQLSEILETNKENTIISVNDSLMPSFNEKTSQVTLIAEKKSKKQAITSTSIPATKSKSPENIIKNNNSGNLAEDASLEMNSMENLKQHQSTASTSPATTIVANSVKTTNSQAPKIQARTSLQKSSLSESQDKEIEAEDVSEILSDEDSHFEPRVNRFIKQSAKTSNRNSKDLEDLLDDEDF